jgi:hypothetical protein
VANQVLNDRGVPDLRLRSIIILFALVIAAGAAVGQDADDLQDDLQTVIPRLHGQPKMVRNIAGQWESAVIVYQDAEVELSVPAYLLDGELAVDAIANAQLPLPWDGKGSYMVALYSFYKTSHGCVLDLQAAKHDSPENRTQCAGIRYQQRFLAIDPQNRTVIEARYMFMGANGLFHLPSAWPQTTYPLDGPLANAHVVMLRKAIASLQPLVDRNAAVNASWLKNYHKMWDQSRQIAHESAGQNDRPRTKTCHDTKNAQSGKMERWCQWDGPNQLQWQEPLTDKPTEDIDQTATSQETAGIEQKALALYNRKDYSDAGPLLDQACAGGGFTACAFLGYMYQNQLGGALDYARAATVYKKACEGGNAFACSQLGYMYQNKLGVEQDYPLAATLFSKACNAGSGNGCLNLGYLYQHSLGVAQDYPRAMSLYSQGCNAGMADGCNSMGVMFESGRGVVKDLSRAAALFSKACDANNPAGCSDLGHSYLVGNGVEKDLEKAKLFFSKGCSLGDKWGCEQVQKLP